MSSSNKSIIYFIAFYSLQLKKMKTIKKTSLTIVLAVIAQLSFAQQWHAGDTLNTEKQDSSRISSFRDNALDLTGQDLVDATFPNSIPIFGTKARFAFGGYVKLDYVQDFNGGYDRFQYEIQNVPVAGDGRPVQSGYMNMFARESRFNFDVRSITEKGLPLRVFFEFDFYNLDRGAFNQSLRVRLAYAVVGRLLFGRSWGTGTDLYAVPTTIDFAAGDALTGTRRAQVRFEDQFANKKYSYAVGVEMLEFPGIDGPDTLGQASQILPMLVGRLTKSTSSGGRLFFSASLFQLRWDGRDIIPNATAFGWGFSFSGRENFGKNHHFIWQASYGQGWGSQIVSTVGSKSSAILTPQNQLETMPALNLGAGVAISISPTLVSNLNIAWYSIDPSVYRSPSSIKSGASGHVNLIWSPIKNVNTGIEYMLLRRTNTDNNFGLGNRLQAMIKYVF
jgi:hypothetical protein